MSNATKVVFIINLSSIKTKRPPTDLQNQNPSINLYIPSSIHFFLICISGSLSGFSKKTWLRLSA
jgi:hypothetical protein